VAILAEARYLDQPQPTGLHRALRAGGSAVSLVNADALGRGPGPWHRLRQATTVVARGRSRALLSALTRLEDNGVATINRRAAIDRVRDKRLMGHLLATADLATPKTFAGTVERLAEQIAPGDYPVVVKPVFGDNGAGIAVVADRHALVRLRRTEPVLGQPYVPNAGFDLKLYGIGDRLWAVKKPSPLADPSTDASASDAPRLVPLTRELSHLGRQCRRLFGLDLFGVDCVVGSRGPVVIEVNDFPNYSAIPGVSGLLAAFVTERVLEKGTD
jgi:ribosomal protein S6--L-glutamate ligase